MIAGYVGIIHDTTTVGFIFGMYRSKKTGLHKPTNIRSGEAHYENELRIIHGNPQRTYVFEFGDDLPKNTGV